MSAKIVQSRVEKPDERTDFDIHQLRRAHQLPAFPNLSVVG
jgi:hypothetical protein